MAAVSELRALSARPRSATACKKFSMDNGIFSTYFASESILRDVVKDSTVDIMHVFFCGMTRCL